MRLTLQLTLRLVLLCLFNLMAACSFSDGRSAPSSNATDGNTNTQATTQPTTPATPESNSSSPDNPTNSNTSSQPPSGTLTTSGFLGFDDLSEASGLAASRNHPGVLWVVSDSGNSAELFAVNEDGEEVARLFTSVTNRDWEDMASFSWNGRHFLVVADSGDNLAVHDSYPLHVFADNLDSRHSSANPLQPLVTFNLRYNDGSHNVEATAIAESDGNLYLVTKGENPGIYATEFMPAAINALSAGNAGQTVTANLLANRIGDLQAPAQTSADELLGMLAGVNLGSVTAMDIDDANGIVWLLTYRGVYKLSQNGNSSWQQILRSEPQLVTRHSLGQAEALAHSGRNNVVFLTSEGTGAPIMQLVP